MAKNKAKKITKKPKLAVESLSAPSRNGYTMSTSWSVPSDLTNTQKNNRATWLDVTWTLGTSVGGRAGTTSVGMGTTNHSIDLTWASLGGSVYKRTTFYPFTNVTLSSVSVTVTPKNGKGSGPSATQTATFQKPRAPEIADLSFAQNGRVSTTITTDAGTDLYERYDTWYQIVVKGADGATTIPVKDSSTDTSIETYYDVLNYQQLTDNQYVQVTATAWSRGYAGYTYGTAKTMYVSYPRAATITGVKVSERSLTGKVTTYINTNTSTEHPVEGVKLCYLANVEYKTAEEIPLNASWTESNIVDNGACDALAMPLASLIPDRGMHTWIRVKSWNLSEEVLYRYSEAKEITELYVAPPTAHDSIIDVISVTPSGDSAVVQLGWNADGHDDSTGTELTWSDEADTWKSTKEPNKFEFEWSDGRYPATGTTQYNDSAEITIKDLEENTHYFIKARRYLVDKETDTTTYSKYGEGDCITYQRPSSVVATCNRYIPKGRPLAVRWSFAGGGQQTEWQIVSSSGTVIANGESSVCATTISADRLQEFAVNGSLTFRVDVSTGSGFEPSAEKTVTIIQQPTLSINAPSTLTDGAYSFTATSNRMCNLVVLVTSNGASGQFPTGVKMQPDGDTIHSNVYSPTWSQSSGTYTATATLPTGLDFWNLGKYTISVIAEDVETKLRSSEVVRQFSVAWANKAVSPALITYAATTDTTVVEDEAYYRKDGSDYILVEPVGTENPASEGWYVQDITEFVTLTTIDTIDADGDHTQAVQISLTPPTGSRNTDVYDIYRMDVENASLIGEGFPLTYTAIDECAPFGSDVTLKYRIALRTIDGDVAFSDIEYEFPCKNMRFDWADGYLELPYENTIGDSFKKDSEIRYHMDGSVDGYWNRNVERKSSLSSCIVKIAQPKDIENARMLARYTGPVFVRLPNGGAFEADAQVTDLSVKNKAITTIQIDATEIGLTDEFKLPNPYALEDE